MSRELTPLELSVEDLQAQRKNYFVSSQKKGFYEESSNATAKRYRYLLGLTELFRHFINARAKSDERFSALLNDAEINISKPDMKNIGDHRHRKTEKQEDAELLNDNLDAPALTVFQESPSYIHGQMRDYQVQGLNWMISLYENNISGILADEMGLGKTIQTVAFLGFLRYFKGISGPHLILVPKSTLDNWRREVEKWTPEVSVVVIQGDKEGRRDLIQNRLLTCDFDVCIASYETILREKTQFAKFVWQYIVVDEAHRIKNEESQLSQIIRLFHSRHRLLVTGTPLQNNLHELWALLNFILPDVFSESGVFEDWFEGQNGDQDLVVKQLHNVLSPFLLRRVKADVEHSLLPKKEVNVYVGMTEMQRKWYQKILERDLDAVNGSVGSREKSRLLNIVMQLRKCCNHPYLFDGAEPGPPYTTDEHLIYNSGKMIMLDKLLSRLKSQGSRVLIFSQMSRVLDILEDYCFFRGYKYCRIDGSTDHENRINAIDEYNRPGSEKFLFLLTTRAGGLGINLVTADTVILYDSDWNPQADLQAMDRAHRIGQTKQVKVFRLVTDHSIDEKVVERAAKKLRLDQLVIQQGRAQVQQSQAANRDDLIQMIQHGAQGVFDSDLKTVDEKLDIDELLAAGESRTAELASKYQKLGLDDLNRFDGGSESAYEWNGQDYKKKPVRPVLIAPQRRERKDVAELLNNAKRSYNLGPRERKTGPRAPKQLHLQDFQFWPQRLYDLQERELAHFKKVNKQKAQLAEGTDEDLSEREAEQRLEQFEIDHAEPLTDAEKEEKRRLSVRGFNNWHRRDLTAFVHLLAENGRDNIEAIMAGMPEKSQLEILTYHEAFWRRGPAEIELFQRYQSQVEAYQERVDRLREQNEIIKKKVESCTAPMQQLQIDVPQSQGKRTFSEQEDRFLMMQLYTYGLDAPNLYEQVREAIRESPLFRFDWFFLSRTPLELQRRGQKLIASVRREFGEKRVKPE